LRHEPSLSEADCVALRCLIVDDNEEFLASSSRLLEAQGLEVVGRASSGEEAVQLAERLDPDVALVDVQLGEEDGLEIARRLSASAPATRVVLISTHSRDDLAELIAESPAVGFLAKTGLSAAAVAELVG
jgi:two-component system, NarL family, nitrate/nitrite response regulator NarL